MIVTAVVMAGGRSERMRVSAGPRHKALVEIAGMTLLERNVRQLIGSGFRSLIVTMAADEPELALYVSAHLTQLARKHGAILTPAIEATRLGNIGFVGTVGDDVDHLLVVYADNLTSIDLRAIVEHHLCVSSDLTIAVHREPFAIPYGMVEIECGRVRAYREKPTLDVPISSGTCVVGRRARRLVPAGKRLEASELFGIVERAGLHVAAYEHNAPWVDVNDSAAIARAESLLSSGAVP